ncbi:hypothetical protein B5X24_HaOG212706 [Helicoverpa armigera]|nr:hypothetical protein B5X24_HaOG212706 [Helicoverpa armigera]
MGAIISTLSNILYLSEKVTLYLTCTGIIACLVIMFIVSLGMGIGLGYNYCFVDLKTKYKYVPPRKQWKGYYGSGYYGHNGPHRPYGPNDPRYYGPHDPRYYGPHDPRYYGPHDPRYYGPGYYGPGNHGARRSFPDNPGNHSAEGELGPMTQDKEDVEDESLRVRITPEQDVTKSPTFLNQSAVQLGNNATQFVLYNISIPYDNDDDDFTVAPSNTISIANTSRNQTAEADETTTDEPAEAAEDDSETTVYSSDDKINQLDEATSEAPTNSNDPNNRRVKKLVIPISGLDLISLLSKLKAENKNYSLQIVTT